MVDLNGFLIVDKPTEMTSFKVIDYLRRVTGVRKIGHGGTLDPFATGVLIIAIGKATKRLDEFLGSDKIYLAKVRFGAVSDTYDRDGVIVPYEKGAKSFDVSRVSLDVIKKVVQQFVGDIEQMPPKFSAIKIKGRRAYDYARKGVEIEMTARKVKVYDIEVVDYKWPDLDIRVRCGKGTYIRSLAFDIGEKLGCGAYLQELRRESVGDFDLRRATKLEDLKVAEDVLKMIFAN
ncbi:MAG: tRNA pseudouridine synthase B, tRNA pseudouridine55 synthase [Candidatus Peregrinibacteria bacterium GW2011_GWF2_38_29]|nr:MAG: tRNA pseudouridine synthase B, tRNA pseudouridine55 synthase [Candidatus Peregrinibacteria bacterium GW2011_GWF2_38_29]HBB02246.1 tRNA pseudouridine(55) synthase TruB [Candidatus Peregrinibacteria bacterium]